MAGFKVDHAALDSLGSGISLDRVGTSLLGSVLKEGGGQTDGFTGILEILKPVISGTEQGSVTCVLAEHYDDLCDIIDKTGTAVQRTAAVYARTESATLRRMDSSAPTVADGHDVRGSGKNTYRNPSGSSAPTLDEPSPQSDPSKAIRDDMAIDVRAIDWLFNKATGHHITDPIDAIVGNWTTVQCDATVYGEVGTAWKYWADDLANYAKAADQVWDGNAAATFQAYMTRLTGALRGEADICNAIKLVLDQVASNLESGYKQAVDLLQSVIHQVESGALLLAALWWAGVGEAAAVEKAGEALEDFMKAWRVVNLVIKLVRYALTAMKAFYKVKALVDQALAVPSEVKNDIDLVKTGLHDVHAAPGVLQDIANLPKEPGVAYGGANAPGIS